MHFNKHVTSNVTLTLVFGMAELILLPQFVIVSDFLRTYHSMLTRLGFWPTLEDIAGLADNILRLWGVYGLKTKDIVNGRVASVETRSLKNSEVETIAQLAKSVKMDYQHLALLEELLNRTDDESEKIYYRKKLSKEYYLVSMEIEGRALGEG